MSDVVQLLIILLPLVLAIAVDECAEDQNFGYTISFTTGFSLLLALQVLLAEQEILVHRPFLIGIWLIALTAPLLRIAQVLKTNLKKFLGGLLLGLGLLSSSFAVWLHPYLRHPSIRGGAPFSNANNDLAIYVISGDNFLNAGFKEFGRVVGYQAGILTNFEVAGSSSLVAFVSRFTQNAVWRSTNLSMLILIALTVVGLYLLMRRWSVPILVALPAAIWLLSAPYARLPQQNYFLSQAISRLALVLAIIGIDAVLRGGDKAHQIRGVVAIASATWLSLVTYPAGSISSGAVLLGVLMAYLLASLLSTSTTRISLVQFLIVGIAFLLPLPLVLSRWGLITSNVSLYSKANVTGWPAPTTSFLDWIGIPSFGPSWVEVSISVILLIGLALTLTRLRRFNSQESLLGLFVLLSIAAAHVSLALLLGQNAYQVWKFLATVQPIALAGLVVFTFWTVKSLTTGQGRNFLLVISAFFFVLVGLNVKASTDTYRSNTQIPSMELEEAAKHPSTRVPNLLIRLDPYLETMIAPVILNVRDAIYASDTYLGPASPDDPRCAISHEQRESDVQIGKRLFVGPAESCK
jgi:hypothetical protein